MRRAWRRVVRSSAAVTGTSVVLLALLASDPGATADAGPDCGATVVKPTGGTWTCTFADDFTSSSLDRETWTVQETATSGYRNGGDCFIDSVGNVSVRGGLLLLTSREEPGEFSCDDPYGEFSTRYSSGMVTTVSSFAQTYGRFEIRAKFPPSSEPGLHSALWMWPVDANRYGAWPSSGEIDIAEVYSQYDDRAIPFLHYDSDPSDSSVTDNYCLVDDVSAFHTYVAEWSAERITITYDGRTCLDHAIDPVAPLKAPAPFDRPFFIALTQTLGLGGNARTAGTPLPATTVVDYVRAWS